MLYLWHGIVMVLAWGVCGLLMCCTNRWMAHGSDKQQYLHSVLGWVMMLSTIGLIVPIINMDGLDLTKLHNIEGMVLMALVIFVSLQGTAAYMFKQEAKWNKSPAIKLMRQVHRWSSWLLILLSFFAITSGVAMFAEKTGGNFAILGVLLFWILVPLLIGFEVLFRRMRRREDSLEIDLSQYPKITASDFEKRVKEGEKLYILDNLVLNLESYIHQHPGGAFLMEQTVGRDISKFFYGAYTLDGNTNSPSGKNPALTVHSNVARKISLRHIVAVIWDADVDCHKLIVDHTQTQEVNSFTKSFVLKLANKTLKTSLKDFYPDLSTLG